MNCEECKGRNMQTIPYVVHESEMARAERQNKRLWIALIIVVILLFASIVVNYVNNNDWLNYMDQYDFASSSIEATQDGDGVNIVGGGNIDYGAEGQDNSQNPD